MEKRIYILIALFLIIGVVIGISLNKDLFSKTQKEEKRIIFDERIVEAPFVAVDSLGNGVTAILETHIRPGSGQILVNINDTLADLNTQYSARLAAGVAANYTGIDLSTLDVIYNLKTDATVVGGQSAGSIMAISTIVALENKQLKEGVMITGSILEDGTIAEAGAIKAKAQAAKNASAKIFLVPSGHASSISTEFKRVKKCEDVDSMHICVIKYEAEKSTLGDEIGIEVREVKNVDEALEYFL